MSSLPSHNASWWYCKAFQTTWIQPDFFIIHFPQYSEECIFFASITLEYCTFSRYHTLKKNNFIIKIHSIVHWFGTLMFAESHKIVAWMLLNPVMKHSVDFWLFLIVQVWYLYFYLTGAAYNFHWCIFFWDQRCLSFRSVISTSITWFFVYTRSLFVNTEEYKFVERMHLKKPRIFTKHTGGQN